LVARAASADGETLPGTQISWDPEPLVTDANWWWAVALLAMEAIAGAEKV
jgi:hypothetical protein